MKRLLAITFIVMLAFLVMPKQELRAGDYEVSTGVCQQNGFTGSFADQTEPDRSGGYFNHPCFGFGARYIADSGFYAGRKVSGAVYRLQSEEPLTGKDGEVYYPKTIVYGGGGFFLGWSFGDETRMDFEIGITEPTLVHFYYDSTADAFDSSNQKMVKDRFPAWFYGFSINFGGDRSGMILAFDYHKIKTDDLLGTGLDFDASGWFVSLLYRFRGQF